MPYSKNTRVFAAIPLMDELNDLPALLGNIASQGADDFKVIFCVNQPDTWWDDKDKRKVCENNLASIELIRQKALFPFEVIDKASRGKGWQGKQLGVGWARKVAMDAVSAEADSNDIMITLDGDTDFNPGYFRSVLANFAKRPAAVGLSVPYYHRLTGSEAEDRAILRYEIYMRSYSINLWRIGNPYHFTALGSAMAVPVSAYRAIGGMSPKKSGEDFYFLQKLTKYGLLLTWNEEKVYPAARFSDRVFFGTGPAMIKGSAGDWDSYPVYHHSLFDAIRQTYESFATLYTENRATPMDDFISTVFQDKDIWTPLRKNSKSPEVFARACRDKIDGLRILQYLKLAQKEHGIRDEDCLTDYFREYQPGVLSKLDFFDPGYTFDDLPVESLNAIRDILTGIEEDYQKSHHHA